MDASLHHQFADIERDHWWFQGRRRVVAAVLRRRLGPSGARRVLDVGCGTGEMVDMLREFGSVTALDAAPEAVDYCCRRFGDAVDVRLGAIPDDVPNGPFDLLSAFDVIEHLDDDRRAVQRFGDALAPGATLVVTVPAFGFLWGPHDVLAGHRRRYRPAELAAVLSSGGLVIDRLSCFNTWLFPAVAAVRAVRRRRSPEPRSDFATPPPVINRALLGLLASEAPVVARFSVPVGVSIVALAHRPGTSGDRQDRTFRRAGAGVGGRPSPLEASDRTVLQG